MVNGEIKHHVLLQLDGTFNFTGFEIIYITATDENHIFVLVK